MTTIDRIKMWIVEQLGVTDATAAQLKICEVDAEELKETLQTSQNFGSSMQSQVAALKQQTSAQASNITVLTAELNLASSKSAADEHEISGLKDRLAFQEPSSTQPAWLDSTQMAYQPCIRSPDNLNNAVNAYPCDIYTKSTCLFNHFHRFLAAYNIDLDTDWDALSLYQKLEYIWWFTIDSATYFEVSDLGLYSWQTAVTTINTREGDCDKKTTVFLSACWMFGISAERVFNDVGHADFGYHSYPIVWLEEVDLMGTPLQGKAAGWYIFEATLPPGVHPVSPTALAGSIYHCDNLANWNFQGTPTAAYKAVSLNGMATAMPGALPVLNHSRDKNRAIFDYWAKVGFRNSPTASNFIARIYGANGTNGCKVEIHRFSAFLNAPSRTVLLESNDDFIADLTDACIPGRVDPVVVRQDNNDFYLVCNDGTEVKTTATS